VIDAKNEMVTEHAKSLHIWMQTELYYLMKKRNKNIYRM